MKKQILSTQFLLSSPINKNEVNNSSTINQIMNNNIYFSLSKYSDSLMIVINQTKNMGSIIKATFLQQILPQIDEDQQAQFSYQQPQYIYQIKTLFGSTEIQFYELITRMALKIIFQQIKAPKTTKVIFNISLPVKQKQWQQNQSQYYLSIQKKLQDLLQEIL